MSTCILPSISSDRNPSECSIAVYLWLHREADNVGCANSLDTVDWRSSNESDYVTPSTAPLCSVPGQHQRFVSHQETWRFSGQRWTLLTYDNTRPTAYITAPFHTVGGEGWGLNGS